MKSIAHRLFQQPWPEGEYRLFQIGFVVNDLIGTATRWARVFGVGPFHVLPRMQVACTYRGAASTIDMQVCVAQAGPVQVELIEQHSDGPSVFRDMFEPGASGFHQLCTLARDYDGAKAHYAALGYDLRCELTGPGQRVAYFDTVREFGFFTEIAEETPRFLTDLERIAQTCAEWDGSDPVRILTRGGYRIP
jgi:hypothetical protein